MKKLILYSIILVTVLSTGCATPKHAYKKGNMQSAVELAIKRLRKHKVKDKDVIILEKAFAIINKREYDRLQVLLSENDDNKWPKVNSIAKRIYNRQQELKPYLPLYIKSQNREAVFTFFPVKELMIRSKEKAAEQYYKNGLADLAEAKKGNRRAARSAYANFEHTSRYYRNYKDTKRLMEEAHRLGTTYAVIGLTNETNALLPSRFKNAVLRMYPSDLNTFWTKFDLNPKARKYDYKVMIRLTNVAATPEEIRNNQFIEEKEIKDGFEYVMDQNGNVAKDSLGNDIVQDKYITVRANVFSTEQHKATTLTAFVDVINTHTGERLMSRQVTAESVFSNFAMRYEGDKRALSKETRRNLGNRPVPFPSNEQMLIQAAEALSPKIKDMICDHISIMED
ncbi:MAG TPA: hypothetical protein ENK85_06125 [Saprospiraceae bacterium]|nr:hypothetical protein [Saprospiraceae bacterium]